jgi:hypothetical protein
MLTLKKYLAISALSLIFAGQMNAMNKEDEQVSAHVKEAQEAYQLGFYLTKNFNNIVCDGDKAFATNATDARRYTAVRNMGVTNKFEIKTMNSDSHTEAYELGSCAAYFKAMVSIQNNEKARNDLRAMKDEILKNQTKALDPLASSKLKGSLIHMIINNNI